MIGRSLRLRLLASAAVMIVIALGSAWYVMGRLFERFTERRMAAELVVQGDALIAGLHRDAAGRLRTNDAALDRRFGRRASGLYWQITLPNAQLRSSSLADKHLAAAPQPPGTVWRRSEIPGPYETDLVSVGRAAAIGGLVGQISVGQDDEPLDQARAAFTADMALYLGALGVALALASWGQVELGLRPLRRVGDELEAMQRRPARRLGGDHPREIAGLVAAINALAAARQEDVARARRRAADLAHALKTPLAALAAQNRQRGRGDDSTVAAAIDRALSSANAAVEAELARARAAVARAGAEGESSDPAALAERLFAVLERTDAGADLVFDCAVPEEWRIELEDQVLAEMFGNLLENATRYARRMVRLSGVVEDGQVRFFVDDDGPGLAAELRQRLPCRGLRLDQTGAGHGLGLSIVADLAAETEGRLRLAESPLGGLRAELCWPASLLPPPA